MLIIVNTDLAVLEWLSEFGGSVKEKRVIGDRKRCWHWRLGRTSAVVELLTAILPHLRIKKDKAESMLEELNRRLGEKA